MTAVDCVVGDWGEWDECNTQCGRGVMTRKRKVVVEARNGGQPCGTVSERRLCWGSNCKVARSNTGVEEMRGWLCTLGIIAYMRYSLYTIGL